MSKTEVYGDHKKICNVNAALEYISWSDTMFPSEVV